MAYDGSLVFDTKIDKTGFEKGLGALESTGKTVGTAIAGALAVATAAIIGIGTYATSASIEFESAFAGVKKTIDGTNADFEMLEKGIRDMAKNMPQSASAIAEVAESAGQLGIEISSILGFTETMVMLGDATNMGSEEAATALARLSNITGMSQDDFDRLGSSIVDLGNNLATTESDIVDMALRLAGTGSQIGLSEHQILALSGAMSSVGINAESGGSSFSRVMQKINSDVLSGGGNLEKFAKISGMSADEFSKKWKNEPEVAIQEFVAGLGKVKDSGGDVAGALKEMGISSIQEVDTLLRLSGAGDLLAESLDISANAWEENTALVDEANQRYQTTESKMAILKNNIDDLAIAIGDELKSSLLDTIDVSTEMVSRLSTAFEEGGFPGLVGEIGAVVADILALLAENTPKLLEMAVSMVQSFIQGIKDNLPSITESALEVVQTLIESALTLIPDVIELGAELIVSLINGIAEMMPDLITQAIDTIISVADTLIDNLPLLVDAGMNFIMSIIDGLIGNLPTLIESVPRIINDFTDAIIEQLPKIIAMGIEIIMKLIKGLIDSIPTLVANIPAIIMAIVNVFTLYNFAQIGKNAITKIGQGIKNMTSNIGTTAKNLSNSVIKSFKDILNGTGIFDIGANMIKGLWNGINSVKDWILSKISGFTSAIMSGLKGFFGIKSPSTLMRDEIGKNLALGIGVGFEAETDDLNKDINREMANLTKKMQSTVDIESANVARKISANNGFRSGTETVVNNNDNGVTQNVTIVNPERTPSENARELRKVGRDLALGY